jgi:hypothetical protein
MATDHVAALAPSVPKPSRWNRFWTTFAAYAEAIEMPPSEWQDRRIAALEAELVRLRAIVERQRPV